MNGSINRPLNPSPPHRRPWYREPWPWLLIAIPLLGVVFSSITATYAMTHPDEDVRTHVATPLDKTNWEKHR